MSCTEYDDDIQGRISYLLQDREGLMWFASFNGLNKYDGYKFTKYKSNSGDNDSSLLLNRIDGIWENSRGDIWCSTSDGIFLFLVKEERFINVQQAIDSCVNSLPDYQTEGLFRPNQIWFVHPFPNGVTWIVAENGYCFRICDDDPLNTCQILPYELNNWQQATIFFVDAQGGEWLFSELGVYRYGSEKVVAPWNVQSVYSYRDGLWMTTTDARMFFYSCEQSHWEEFSFPLSVGQVYHQQQQGDSLLISATDLGVFVTNLSNGSSVLRSTAILRTFKVDCSGSLWGMTEEHNVLNIKDLLLDTLDVKVKKYSLPKDHRFEDYRIVFKEDEYGLMWLLFYDTIDVLYLDTEKACFVRPMNSTQSTESFNGENGKSIVASDQSLESFSMIEDRQGNLWYHRSNGIDRITLHNNPFELNDSVNDEVRSLMVDSKGRFWMGLRQGKVVVFDKNAVYLGNLSPQGKLVKDKDLTLGVAVYCMKEDSHHRIWLGSKLGGLFMLSPTLDHNEYRMTHYTHDENDSTSLSSSSVYAVEEDSAGHIWIGGFGGGLNLYQDDQFYNAQNGLALGIDYPLNIRVLKEVRPGILMIGSKEGLYVMDTRSSGKNIGCLRGHHKQTNTAIGLSDNDVMSILCTSRSEIYLSTNSGGVCRVLSEELMSEQLVFKAITKIDGIGSDVVYSMVEDNQQHLWVVCPRSISCIMLDDKLISVYGESYFLRSPVFSEASPVFFEDNIYLGELNGIICVNPNKIVNSSYCPPIVFTGLSVKNKPSFQRLGKADKLLLGKDERIVNLQFAAIDYLSKKHLKYAYKLDGVDSDWNETPYNSVTYINMPSGRHLFHVKSTDVSGVWRENERTMEIVVQPHFRETIWGMMVFIILIIATITLCVMVFLRIYHLRHRLLVEQQVTDAKLRFFTDISHELRTPLMLVDGPVDEVLEDKTLSDQSRYYLEIVQNNVRRMLHLVNQILDFRKIQNKKMVLLIEQFDPKQAIERIMENFMGLAESHHISFVMENLCAVEWIWADRDKFEKIFFNLISNAFKYTSDGKRILIRLFDDQDSVSISIIDEGRGIKKEDIQSIFQRFETILDSNIFKPSSGIGLSLVKQFADMHHATVDVQSQQGKGSLFTVRFLKGKKHFENNAQVDFYVTDMPSEKQTVLEKMPPLPDDQQEKSIVLLVEDNDELRNFMRHMLSPYYNVLEASNGEEGLRLGREKWPDLVITDAKMPYMDGIEMVRQIKADHDIYQVPIIMLTAQSSMDDRIRSVEMGVDDYVMKPFSTSYLKARVASLILQRRQLKENLMERLSQGNFMPLGRSLEPDMPQITPADELFIQEVMAFMEKNMDNPKLTIDDFAKAVKMGRTVFYNKLKATIGLSPIDFVQQMRLKRAMQLIKTHNFTISEIAYQTGFNEPRYFSRCFKKYYGQNPSECLKKDEI